MTSGRAILQQEGAGGGAQRALPGALLTPTPAHFAAVLLGRSETRATPRDPWSGRWFSSFCWKRIPLC